MPEKPFAIESLSEADVDRIASTVAAKMRAEPPPLGDADRERIVEALAARLGGERTTIDPHDLDPEAAHEHEETWTAVLERGEAPDDPERRALEGM